MQKYKYNNYSYVALLLALILGLVLGSILKSNVDNVNTKQLVAESKSYQKKVDSLKRKVFVLEKESFVLTNQIKEDSVELHSLLLRLKAIKVNVNKETNKVNKLTNEEITNWFSTRYSK